MVNHFSIPKWLLSWNRRYDTVPATVLTNATVFKDVWLARLRDAEAASDYSLEFRVSIDGFSAETNDPIRGEGTFDRAMRGVQQLVTHGFLPIITAARTWPFVEEQEVLTKFRNVLIDAGYTRPRLMILPTLQIGAEQERTCGYRESGRVTAEMMDGFDETALVCEHSRIVTDRGVHVCPILIESPDSLLGATLTDATAPFTLCHGACYTCYQLRCVVCESVERRGAISWIAIALPASADCTATTWLWKLRSMMRDAVAWMECTASATWARLARIPIASFPAVDRQRCAMPTGGTTMTRSAMNLTIASAATPIPQDKHFAQISYDYTLANTSAENRAFLRKLPPQLRLEFGPLQLLLCHGSPRRVNEFLWESTTSTAFLDYMATETQADIIVATHTGIKWQRSLSASRAFVNVGVLGRPENDGQTNVWYTLLSYNRTNGLRVDFIPVEYDFRRLATEMKDEQLPRRVRGNGSYRMVDNLLGSPAAKGTSIGTLLNNRSP